jgi:hypothetical protein
MSNGEDPTIRRRADREGLNQRDEQCWTLRQQRWSVRAIGRELNMPASSVQRCLERAAKRSRPGNVLAAVDDELSAEDPELSPFTPPSEPQTVSPPLEPFRVRCRLHR